MTNKKFKVAAMSMALTACVAAQPLIANAADDVESVQSNSPDTAPSQTEESVSSAPADTSNASAPEEVQNAQADNAVDTIGDPDISVDYDHDKDQTDTGEDGSTTTVSTGDVNRNETSTPEETPPEEKTPEKTEDNTDNPTDGTKEEQKTDGSKNTEDNTEKGQDTGSSDGGKTSSDTDSTAGDSTQPSAPTGSSTEQVSTPAGSTGNQTPDDSTPSNKKDIGDANKSETVKKDTDLVLGETTTETTTTTNPDGSTTTTTTTTTDATLETTTTGTGEASAKTDETFTEDVKDTLDKELDGGKLSWDTAEGATFGDYTVSTVGDEKDGKKEFTLTKEDKEETGTMTGKDIAKLIEAGYTDNGDGTYTLTKDYTDSKGQKQTTTITVDSSTATKTTSTTLTITLESQKHDDGKEDFGNPDYTYPSTDITVKDNNQKDHTFNLKDILDKAKADKDGTFVYEDKENNLTYTITRKEGSEDLSSLSDRDLKKLLNEHAGSEKYTLDNEGNLCYITDKGEKCRVTNEQNTLLRSLLTLDITITDHHGKESDTSKVKDSDKTPEEAKADAKKEAQEDALRKALAEAIKQETGKDVEIDLRNATLNEDGKTGKFEWTDPDSKKTYIFNYTELGTVSGKPETIDNPTTIDKDASSAEKNTETGTAEVSGSTVIWTEEGKTYTDTTVKETFGDGYDFTKENEDKLTLKGSAEYDEDNRLTKFVTEDGKTYTFKYSEGSAPDGLGTTSDEKFTKVEWTVTEKTKEVKKEDEIDVGTISIVDKAYTENADGTYNFKVRDSKDGKEYEYKGLTKNEDGTYSKTYDDGSTIIISVTPSKSEIDVKAALEAKGYTDITVYDDGTVTYTDNGVKYKGRYSASTEDITLKKYEKMEAPVTANGSSEEEAKNNLLLKIQEELGKLKDDESLLFDGKYEFTKNTSKEEIKEIISKVVNCAVDFEELGPKALQELLEKQKADADAAGKSYTGTHEDSWFETEDGKRVDSKQVKYDKEKNQYYIKWGKEKIYVVKKETEDDYIEHLDLATDSNLKLAEKDKDGKDQTDCVLVDKKLEWNEDAGKLIRGEGNTIVGLGSRITYDDEDDDKAETGHYEFARATWDNQYPGYYDPSAKDNNPDRSVYYKLTGTVAYGQVGDTYTAQKGEDGKYDYKAAEKLAKDALKQYKEDYVKNGGNIDDLKNARVVEICADQTPYGERSYKIYLYTSSLTAYGYLSDYSNVCGNAHGSAMNPDDYVGGYDLRIDDLTQINKERVTAHGKDDYSCAGTLSKLTKKLDDTSKDLDLTPTHKITMTYEDQVTGGDDGLFGSYTRHMREEHDYSSSDNEYHVIRADSTVDYTTYKTWEDTTAHWSDKLEKTTGTFTFDYTSTKDAKVAKATKETRVRTKSSVKYHYSYVEREELDPIIETKTVTTPGGGGGDEIIENNTPESPVLPGNPELPPVQDACPDAPVLPSDPVLPPVQDARIDAALPQTGVNWLTAIGLALSGMTLMVTGAFASLTGKKAKH